MEYTDSNKYQKKGRFLAGQDDHRQAANGIMDAYDEGSPIAELFPYTTVLFADIAGFTAWSSVREPSQVFVLLQSVYKEFDLIANARNVFKVWSC